MNKRKMFNKIIATTLAAALTATTVLPNIKPDSFLETALAGDTVSAISMGKGSIGNGSNSSQAANLPTYSKQGTYRKTTSNYDSTHAAIDTTDWATNWMWDLQGDSQTDSTGALTGTAYALPFAYIYKNDGLRLSKPGMTSSGTNVSAYMLKSGDSFCDWKISPDWTATECNIDDSSDWTYEALVKNPSNSSQSLRLTMTQGSPFTYFDLTNTNVLYLEKLRISFYSEVIYDQVYDNSRVIVFRTLENVGAVNGFPSTKNQYYAIYLPAGTTYERTASSDTVNDKIGKYKFTLPSGHTYATFAWLCESKDNIDSSAISVAKDYRAYAYNFVTDTKATYSYNESTSKLTTTYAYSFEKKSESTADGTIMGILPHQYKNMSGVTYLSQQAITVRGYMKFMKGSSFTTNMTYNGIIPTLASLPESDTEGNAKLQEYVDKFVDEFMTGSGNWLMTNDEGGDTYYHAKKLNRSAQVVAAAKSVGDEESADKVLSGLEAKLADWFTYSGENDDVYFEYYGDGMGALLGFPSCFDSVSQMNDHHFHYGYFIESAAMVGMWDPEWLDQYSDVIKQLIYDIACPYRSDVDASTYGGNAYPYLRSFAPYEGHSWASGYQDENDGNNQESTSEAINAWAGIILFGELTGDDELRDLGIYLYETEVASADEYWFNIDGDNLTIDSSNYDTPVASMVWGGKMDYATYFGMQYCQGIQICPMQSWSYYLLDGGTSYIDKFYDYALNGEHSSGGAVMEGGWNDLWAEYYALKDPTYSLDSIWTTNAVNDGESFAHVYQFIKSMQDYGTPDTSYVADTALYAVYSKDGVNTYAVYNAEDTKKTVTFTSSTGTKVSFTAKPNGTTLFSSNDIGKVEYTVEYYGKNLNDGGYTMLDSQILYASSGSNVSAKIKNFIGYEYNSSNASNKISATVNANGSTVLKVYYDREVYTVSFDLNGGSERDSSLYITSYTFGQNFTFDAPIKDGYDFQGWYTEAKLENKCTSITGKSHGNLTLYAKWLPAGTIVLNDNIYLTFDMYGNGTYIDSSDADYNAVSVLFRIYDTKDEAKASAEAGSPVGFTSWGLDSSDSGWTNTVDYSGSVGKWIVYHLIRYNDYGGYSTSFAYGQIIKRMNSGEVETGETTTEDQGDSSIDKPFGLVAYCSGDNKITVVWGTGTINNYNIYIDDVLVKSNTWAASYDFSGYSVGVHTVAITTVSDGKESKKAFATVQVTGSEETTAKETTKQIETTKETRNPESTSSQTTTKEVVTGENVTTEQEETSSQNKVEPVDYTDASSNWNELEHWQVYEASGWGGDPQISYADGGSFDNFKLKINDPGNTTWAVQMRVPVGTMPVEAGSQYVCAISLKSNLAQSNTITFVEDSTQTNITPTLKQGVNNLELEFTASSNGYANIVLGLGNLLDETEIYITSFKLMKKSDYDKDKIASSLEINGFQISTSSGGFRTLYSVEPTIGGSAVTERGLIYGISDNVNDSDMTIDTENPYVYYYAASIGLVSGADFASSDTMETYAMTMKFAAGTSEEYNSKYLVRAYARLADGSVVYSKVSSCSVYNVAENLYTNHKMLDAAGHDYLYNKILSVVNPAYTKIAF